MTSTASRALGLPVLTNFRDLGGWSAGDGATVRSRLLFRSKGLTGLDADDRAVLDGLRLSRVYDFRSVDEVTESADPELAGVRNVHLDVLADSPRSIAANMGDKLADPAHAAELTEQLAKPEVHQSICEIYRGLVSFDSARRSFGGFFTGLLDDPAPALFHCTAGKDRTGWAAAAFLSLMGVSRDDVYAEYLLTNDQLLVGLTPLFERFAAAGGDPEVLKPVFGVVPGYLDAAFAELDTEFGSVAGYFADGLGIDADAQQALREKYLDRSE
ncbi:tyrosine-protein phosphatase [Gordonia sp. TBRC 11910]|uniref:Tyrosine-protein phosphatase n=1 Tax=Gordonia asplenii TaxID=2725283 RepID=A0A848KX09_9ACTN|nr:tyrosine-protein phosphatase [Gordonia asplenii]NMO00721.1 tyrosine-protein phosphatase [Gordonia asplenii]